MVDWVVSCRVNEFCYAESLTRKGTGLWWLWGLVALLLPLKPQAVLV
jgi:hypothetical protein